MGHYTEYLEDLRESGVCNMWLAPEYLMDEFGLTRREARAIFNDWKGGYCDE